MLTDKAYCSVISRSTIPDVQWWLRC